MLLATMIYAAARLAMMRGADLRRSQHAATPSLLKIRVSRLISLRHAREAGDDISI